MDIHDLEAFKCVYEACSFTEAAQTSYVSRQALSKTVCHLERQLGALFTRKARGVAPTRLADAIYPHVCRMLSEFDAVRCASTRFSQGQVGSLRLAIEANAAITLPVGLTQAYSQARPDVELVSQIMLPSAAREALRRGDADAVLAGPPCDLGEGRGACSMCPGGCAQAPQEGLLFIPIFVGRLVIVFSRAAFDGDELSNFAEPASASSGARHPNEVSPREQGIVPCSCSDEVAPQLCIEALAGRTVFGIDPANSVERKLAPYLAAHVPSAKLVYGNPDTALTTSMMRAGHGGVIVEQRGAGADFGDAAYVHVPLTGDDAPVWEVGVSFAADSPAASIARDFADFARVDMAARHRL